MELISTAVNRVPTAGLQCPLEKTSCPSNSHCWTRQVFPLSSCLQSHNLKVSLSVTHKGALEARSKELEEVSALSITWDFYIFLINIQCFPQADCVSFCLILPMPFWRTYPHGSSNSSEHDLWEHGSIS